PSLFRSRGIASLLRQRQIHDENRPLPKSITFGADRSAMQLHQVPHDRKTEPESALSSGDRAFSLTKTIEHVRQKLRRDTSPVSLTLRRAVDSTQVRLMLTLPPRCVNLME